MYSFSGNCAESVPISTFMCSVSDLYISRIGPHISCSRIGRSIDWSQTHEYGNWDCGRAILFLGILYLLRNFSTGYFQCNQMKFRQHNLKCNLAKMSVLLVQNSSKLNLNFFSSLYESILVTELPDHLKQKLVDLFMNHWVLI